MSDWTVEVVSAPAWEPVSLAEAKAWMKRQDTDADDAIIRGLVQAMRERAENITGRTFIKRQVRVHFTDWCWHKRFGLWFQIPRAPLLSVESFKYYDEDGALQTLATNQYEVHTEREPGFIIPAWQVLWPTVRRVPYPIQIVCNVGYAPVGSPEDEAAHQEPMPEALKLWMEANALTVYDNRAQIITGTIVSPLGRTFQDGLLDDLVMGDRLF